MSDGFIAFNGQVITDLDQCTLEICPIDVARFHYLPNLPGNIFIIAVFGICLIAQLFFGIRHKTWGYLVGMFCGLLLEILGYVGRIMLHDNPFLFNNFLLYLICLTIAPAFISAATYLCLGRIVVIYGEQISRLKPRTYTILFVSCDLFSLILQAAGGAIASVANDSKTSDIGINVMIAGLISQVVSLAIFMALCADFWWSARKRYGERDPAFAELRESKLWKGFLWALAVATIAIFIRSAYRVAELFEGFDSELANNEPLFMALEAAMLSIAAIALTVFHPGVAFRGNWDAGNFSLRGRKNNVEKGPAQSEYSSVDMH